MQKVVTKVVNKSYDSHVGNMELTSITVSVSMAVIGTLILSSSNLSLTNTKILFG